MLASDLVRTALSFFKRKPIPVPTPEEEEEEPRTEEEILIEQLICPDCLAEREFLSGPNGGFAQNIKCAKCGLILNVIFNGRQLVWHERINHHG
jgi:hypothetical protein